MPLFDIPLVRRDARPAGSDELGRAIVSVEAGSLPSAIRKAESAHPRWTASRDALDRPESCAKTKAAKPSGPDI
ncbi:MAG TPA: hypothetical protein VGM87_26060 [Roseomonas sp.]|jgi:hypothetical protein